VLAKGSSSCSIPAQPQLHHHGQPLSSSKSDTADSNPTKVDNPIAANITGSHKSSAGSVYSFLPPFLLCSRLECPWWRSSDSTPAEQLHPGLKYAPAHHCWAYHDMLVGLLSAGASMCAHASGPQAAAAGAARCHSHTGALAQTLCHAAKQADGCCCRYPEVSQNTLFCRNSHIVISRAVCHTNLK